MHHHPHPGAFGPGVPVAHAGVAMHPGAPGAHGVELGPAENAIIATTAGRARTWGTVALVVGVLATLGLIGAFAAMELLLATTSASFPANVPRLVLGALIPAALVHLAVGALYLRAGSALQEVVDTQGDDVRHLMSALDRLRLAFQIEVGVTILSLIAGAAVWMMTTVTARVG